MSTDTPPALTVRTAVPADLDDLVALSRRFCAADGHDFDEDVARSALAGLLAADHLGVILVAEITGTPVGYAVVTMGYSIESGGVDALLDEIYLDVRGQGLGSLLLEEVLEVARQRGAHRLFLETEAANSRARDFYRRHQFEQQDSIWLSRNL